MLNKKSIGIVAVINILSTVLGLGYSVVLARYFGVGPGIEVYFAATTLLFMLNSLTQSGQLAEIALPIYHKYQHGSGQEEANRVMSVILNWMGLLALVFSVVAFVFAPTLFRWSASGFHDAQQHEGAFIFRIIAPLLFLEIMKSQITSLVNAEKKFGRIEWVNIINQLISILFIVLLSGRLQVYAVVAGLWVGEVAAVLYGVSILRNTHFRYHFVFAHRGFSVLNLWKKMSFTFLYVIAAQGYLFFLNNLVTHLPRGQYAIYRYALLLFTKLQGLLVRPVSTVFFSQFSHAFHSGTGKIKALMDEANSLSFVLSALLFGAIIATGHPLLQWLWGGDKFDSASIHLVYLALSLISVCVFFNSLSLIYRKIAMTLGLVKEQYTGNIAVQLVTLGWLWLMQENVSNSLVYSTLIVNNCILACVPIGVAIAFSEGRILFGIGQKWLHNILFFLSISAVALAIENFVYQRFIDTSPILALGIQSALFGIFSIGMILILNLHEVAVIQSLIRKLSNRK